MVSTTKHFLATAVINIFCPEKSCYKKENEVKKNRRTYVKTAFSKLVAYLQLLGLESSVKQFCHFL